MQGHISLLRRSPGMLAVLCLITGLWAAFTPMPAESAITAVNTTPAARSVPLGRAGSVAFVWNVTRTLSSGAGGTVSSASGTFRAGSTSGTVLGTVARSLSQTRPGTGVTVFAFRESVLVPSAVIHRAHRLGVDRIFYVRTFDDGVTPGSGAIPLRITGGAGGSFGIARLALSFEDGSVIAVAEPDTPLHATAQITVSGSGLLRAVWEVADSAATAGSPVFRPLGTVRRYVTGRERITLQSPPLPTQLTGLHLVRLRINEPAPDFEIPQLRYFVRAVAAAPPPATLELGAPSPAALLHDETQFSWQAVAAARAYRLEIGVAETGAANETVLTAGVVVGAERAAASLSPMTRSHLQPASRYRWRVLAIDADGRVIARSDWRELRTP
ncbi:MAG TPA: hypothetical protein ENJ01_11180 [Gammaproteobacteria bacterium]|nr:hypothetical protein [Gammaproteobacteria bacterium]